MAAGVASVKITGNVTEALAALDRLGIRAEEVGKKTEHALGEAAKKTGGVFSRLGSQLGSWGLPFSESLSKMGERLGDTETKGHKFGSALAQVGKSVVLGLGGAALAVGSVGIEAAISAEKVDAQLKVAVRNTGAEFDRFEPRIHSADAAMRKLGFTNEETNTALTTLTRSLGSPEKALRVYGVAADLARSKNIDLNQAALLVAKGMEGQTRPLKQLGIDLPVYAGGAQNVRLAMMALHKAQANVDAILRKFPDAADAASKGHARWTAAVDKAVAANQKLHDVESSGQTILDALQQRVRGAAAAYGDTFAGKVAAAKAQLSNLAEKVGQILIPILTRLMGATEHVVSWFERHKDVAYALAGVVGGALAIAVGATAVEAFVKLGRTVAGVGSHIVDAGTGLVRFGAGVARAEVSIKGMESTSYTSGLRIRQGLTAVGSTAQSMGSKLVSAFSTAEARANMFKTALGTIGLAAFEYGVYSAGKAISNLTEKGNSFARVMDNAGAMQNQWKQALLASNGALTEQVQLSVAASLQQSGLADKAARSGITLVQLTQAVTGNKAALDGLIAKWKEAGSPSDNTIVALAAMNGEYRQAATSARQLASVEQQGTSTMNTQTSAADQLANALNGMQSGAIGVAQAIDSFKQAEQGLAQSVRDQGTATLNENTAAGVANHQALVQAAAAALQHVQAMQQQGATAQQIVGALNQDRVQLENAAVAAGMNKTQVDALVGSLLRIPKDVQAQITIDTQSAVQSLQALTTAEQNAAHAGNSGQAQALAKAANQYRGSGQVYDIGGWVRAAAGAPQAATVHGGEYVLSAAMLAGTQPIDTSVLAALSKSMDNGAASHAPAAPGPAAAPTPPAAGTSVTVQAMTNANPYTIASEMGWVLRQLGWT